MQKEQDSFEPLMYSMSCFFSDEFINPIEKEQICKKFVEDIIGSISTITGLPLKNKCITNSSVFYDTFNLPFYKDALKRNYTKFIDCELPHEFLAWNILCKSLNGKENIDWEWLDTLWENDRDFVQDILLFKYNRINESDTWITEFFKWLVTDSKNMYSDYVDIVRLFLVAADHAEPKKIDILNLIRNGIIGSDKKHLDWVIHMYRELNTPNPTGNAYRPQPNSVSLPKKQQVQVFTGIR